MTLKRLARTVGREAVAHDADADADADGRHRNR
jgi:hypothetical protein